MTGNTHEAQKSIAKHATYNKEGAASAPAIMKAKGTVIPGIRRNISLPLSMP